MKHDVANLVDADGSNTICFRVTAHERLLLDAVAHDQSETLSELIRKATFDAVRAHLDKQGRDVLVDRLMRHRKKLTDRRVSRL